VYDLGVFARDVPLTSEPPSEAAEETLNSIVDRVVNDLYLVSGPPDLLLGDDGDTAIDLNALEYYTKTAGAWGAPTALGTSAADSLLLINGRT